MSTSPALLCALEPFWPSRRDDAFSGWCCPRVWFRVHLPLGRCRWPPT